MIQILFVLLLLLVAFSERDSDATQNVDGTELNYCKLNSVRFHLLQSISPHCKELPFEVRREYPHFPKVSRKCCLSHNESCSVHFQRVTISFVILSLDRGPPWRRKKKLLLTFKQLWLHWEVQKIWYMMGKWNTKCLDVICAAKLRTIRREFEIRSSLLFEGIVCYRRRLTPKNSRTWLAGRFLGESTIFLFG